MPAADLPPAPPAIVRPAPATYAGADRLLRAAVRVADLHWPATLCAADINVYDAQTLNESARADEPGCRVWFDRAYRDRTWRTYNDAHEPRAARRNALAEVCALATHERGHNTGLSHGPGVMSAIIAPANYPGACRRWARTLLP